MMYIWAYGQSKVISNYVEIVGCRDIIIEITGYSMINKTVFCRVLKSISTNRGLVVTLMSIIIGGVITGGWVF